MEGMTEIFPVFLDHVLNPILKDSQFTTEVYHLDSSAKHQGVVYCEMASRENTEADLLDLHLRQMIYQNKTTYSYECGGLTKDIQNLSNQEVKDYHKQFYHLDSLTAILCGSTDPKLLFDKLESFSHLFQKKLDIPSTLKYDLHQPLSNFEMISKTVLFPSDDEEVGSIAYGWNGPESSDVKTIIALEVLFRFFNDNPSSPFSQAFVEREAPLASDVDLDMKAFIDSPIIFIFSGVPRISTSEDEDMQSDSEIETSDTDSSDEEEINSEITDAEESEKEDLFSPGLFHAKLMKCIESFVSEEFSSDDMHDTIKRHERKIRESLEDSPHESIAMNLIPDILRFHLASKSSIGDINHEGGRPQIGLRLGAFAILKELAQEKSTYWKALAKKYLVDQGTCEILMIPSSKLANDQVKDQEDQEVIRLESLSKEQISQISQNVATAVEGNKISLSEETQLSFPLVPLVSKCSTISSSVENVEFSAGSQFNLCQVVNTETAFSHLGLVFNISKIPSNMRPYLTLFQELLFQTQLDIPENNGVMTTIKYQDVSTYASKLFISHECAVGFGNSIFSASYLTNTSSPLEWENNSRFASQVVLFSTFTKNRILSISKNLLSSIVDIKRDGNAVLGALITRICLSQEFADVTGNNENQISIFKQEKFLNDVIAKCKNGQANEVIDNLNSIRNFLIENRGDPSFMRIAVPSAFSLNDDEIISSPSALSDSFTNIWDCEVAKYSSQAGKSKKKKISTVANPVAFPFPRYTFALDQLDSLFSKTILVPVAGLSTSYFSQTVPCDLLKTAKSHDYFPTVLLGEILSRSEGPLYDGVRGKGFAYGVSLNCYLWAGHLSFELYRASEPQKALTVFYEILKEIQTDKGFSKYCSKYEIETAKASISYGWASNCATSSSLIFTSLRSSLQGFASLQDHIQFIEQLESVTADELKRVLNKHFLQFLDPSKRITVCCTPTGDAPEKIKEAFRSNEVVFEIRDLEDFNL